MIRWIALCLLFGSYLVHSQQQKFGIVLDAETRYPVEFVDVFNAYDNTHTNEDGKYFMLSYGDSLTFSKIGYQKTTFHFKDLKDTLWLVPSALELDEITLVNMKSAWDKVKDSLGNNYMLSPFKERFFLRSLIRKNGKIVRIQDIEGKLRRKTMMYGKGLEFSKKDFQFEISNMRKIGIEKDENDVYFTTFSLSQLLLESIRLNATGPGFLVREKAFENEDRIRIGIQSDSTAIGLDTNGHYIINSKNNAIESVVLNTTIDRDNYFKNGPIRSRTIKRNQTALFSRSSKRNKYFYGLCKILFFIEITHTKKDFKDIYTSEYILKTYDNDGDFPFSPNANAQKDIFKLKHPYNEQFWTTQNNLLLTDEMKEFIETIGSSNKEFNIRTNLN